MEKLELKHIAPYLPFGVKIQYEGIINTKELSEYKKLEPKGLDFLAKEYSDYWKNLPKEIKGTKVSEIKQIKLFKKYVSIHLGTYHGHLKTCYFHNIKPILRPLSDLTKEIEVNGERFVPLERLCDLYSPKFHTPYQNEKQAGFIYAFTAHDVLNLEDLSKNKYWQIEKLFEWHFDVFGLIESGLAIDINTLKAENE